MPLPGELLLITAALLAAVIAGLAFRNRQHRESVWLALLMLCVGGWSVLHLLEHQTTGTVATDLARLKATVLAPAAFVLFAFVLEYTDNRTLLTKPVLGLLFAWPVLFGLAVWLPEGGVFGVGAWERIESETGVIYWLHVGLSVGLLAAGSVLLLRYIVRSAGVYRRQGLAVLGAIAAAWIGTLIAVFELFGDTHLHALPTGMAVMGGLLLVAIRRTGLTQLTPIARRTIMRSLDAGVVAMDAEYRITYLNPAAQRLLDLEAAISRGDSIDALPNLQEEVAEWILDRNQQAGQASATFDIDGAVIQATLSPMLNRWDRLEGFVLRLNDVTEEHRYREQLERQNDRLEEYSRMVSHDLRNPLTVATGRLELEREERDSENLAIAADALDRMDSLIEELRTLARSGQLIEHLETISLSSVCEDCWRVIDTVGATLVVEDDVAFEANRDRLRQLLENLMSNAVRHGGADVTVRIGRLPDGFFVADDGPGIAAERRADVFTPGYSEAADGSGLGLAIVKEVCEAHGWDIDITDSDSGGARFEVTNVELAEPEP